MSFTRQVKQELARGRETPECCRCWELSAFLLLKGYLTIRGGRQILSIRVDYNILARYLFGLLKDAGIKSLFVVLEREQRLGKHRYVVQIAGEEQVEALLIYLQMKEAGQANHLTRDTGFTPQRRCCRRAFVKGAFLAAGSISVSGKSGYHLEISCSYQEDIQLLQDCLESFALHPAARPYNAGYSLYLKNAEAIADFLRIIGANSALLHLENVRVVKSMRNQVNRLVNCDTANAEKIVVSAQQQLRQIDRIIGSIGLDNIPPALQEAARLRRRFPEASLKELGEQLNPPVSKSGMNHRFRQLERIARECERNS